MVNILVVERSQKQLELYQKLFIERGYVCHACTTIEAALKTATLNKIDFVVFDFYELGCSCEAFVDLFKERLVDWPRFICISLFKQPRRRKVEHFEGVHLCLNKPFNPDALLDYIEHAR